METSDINRNDDSVKIIAEAGINHNGDLDLAMRLVDAAKAAGADVVKFQTGNASASITKYANTADYQKDSTGSDQQLAMIEQLELPFAAYIDIKDYCDEVGIEFATTFFDKDAAYFSLQNLDLGFCKVASGEITNRPLLEIIGSSHLPVILSTGMCTLEEVEDAIAVLRMAVVRSLSCIAPQSILHQKIRSISERCLQWVSILVYLLAILIILKESKFLLPQ